MFNATKPIFEPKCAKHTKLLIRNLKQHMHYRSRIDRLPHAQRRLETHLVGGRDGSFIQSVTQSPDYAIDMQSSIGAEHDFQKNFAFEL